MSFLKKGQSLDKINIIFGNLVKLGQITHGVTHCFVKVRSTNN